MNFKYATMAAALMLGFASCSKDDNKTVEDPYLNTPTEFTIKTSVLESGLLDDKDTRKPSETAVDIPPHVLDMTLIFVGKKNASSPLSVLEVHKGDVAALTGAGQKFKGMPLGITDLYIVGNIEKYGATAEDKVTGETVTLPSADFGYLAAKTGSAFEGVVGVNYGSWNATTKSAFDGLKAYENKTFDQLQAEVKFSLDNYEITDVKAVNIYGHGLVTANQGTTPLELFVRPAISRYEIKGIGLKDNSTLAGTNIYVDGIYISNTMREISFDGTIYGSDATLLNWGWNERQWNYSLANLQNKLTTATPPGTIVQDPNNHYLTDFINYYKPTTTAPIYFPADADTLFGPYNKVEWGRWMDVIKAPAPIEQGGNGALLGDQRYSYYVASARKQAEKPVVNPYDENEAHNFIGLECGTWPYNDEATLSGISRPAWALPNTAIQYGAFPTICIKLRTDGAGFDMPNGTKSKVGWLTVTKFIKAGTTEYLKHPQEGRVYVFKTILFDKENIKPDPMYPDNKTDISVHVEIKGWEEVPVENPF